MTDQSKSTWLKQQIAAAEHLQLSAGHAVHALAASYDATTQRIHVQMSNGAAFSFPPQPVVVTKTASSLLASQ
jgi:hypothetical protein